jgi:hypothetical protein
MCSMWLRLLSGFTRENRLLDGHLDGIEGKTRNPSKGLEVFAHGWLTSHSNGFRHHHRLFGVPVIPIPVIPIDHGTSALLERVGVNCIANHGGGGAVTSLEVKRCLHLGWQNFDVALVGNGYGRMAPGVRREPDLYVGEEGVGEDIGKVVAISVPAVGAEKEPGLLLGNVVIVEQLEVDDLNRADIGKVAGLKLKSIVKQGLRFSFPLPRDDHIKVSSSATLRLSRSDPLSLSMDIWQGFHCQSRGESSDGWRRAVQTLMVFVTVTSHNPTRTGSALTASNLV